MDGSLAESHARFVPETLTSSTKDRGERIGVVGLGYVGLPVSVALAEAYETVIGFDTNPERISALRSARDWTHEISVDQLSHSDLKLTSTVDDLAVCSIIVVAVPTPITDDHRPDFGPLISACRSVGPVMRKGTVVVFESTVHPGATEDICGPELEVASGLKSGVDFHLAYSPERISPGDKQRGFKAATKIVAAQSLFARERVATVYEKVVEAGVFRAPSIKVAEAAKVFENTQRDVNIALMNELSEVCEGLGIRTADVIEATATKWNALPFTPGLVGGHCIGVDPHYLVTCAKTHGVHPDIMMAARRRNEAVADRIVSSALKALINADLRVRGARVGLLGVTFKENVPDTRNSKSFDIITGLRKLGIDPLVGDPLASAPECAARRVQIVPLEAMTGLDLLILAVPHRNYLLGKGKFLQTLLRSGGTLMDVRSALDPGEIRDDLHYWSL